jgi:NAD/NADP transhydrogenase alpha subunit
MKFNILITKETRAGEGRVGMTPCDVEKLITQGQKIFVEHNAGETAGFLDQDYQKIGAIIRSIDDTSVDSYTQFFKDINIVVRVKRPARPREFLENQAMEVGTIMIGALDPLEKHSVHLDEYHKAGIIAYSIDQLELASNDPMNILAAMSKIAGKLALLDAIKKFQFLVKDVVIIGFGVAGRSAFAEAINQKVSTTVIITNPTQIQEIEKYGASAILLQRDESLEQQQEIVKKAVLKADIVITSARKPNTLAPLLITKNTLNMMKKGTVIVDMALSEGGNVEGAEHDMTHTLGNGVIVTNVSGYPKVQPHEASILWSNANLHIIFLLAKGDKIPLLPC